MIETIKVNAGRCDGCGKVRMGADEQAGIPGFMGTVMETYVDGSPGHSAQWYACRERCIGKAAYNAVRQAIEDYAQGRLA